MNELTGILVTWKGAEKYGFIRPNKGGPDVFVHLRSFGRTARPPRQGDEVRYRLGEDRHTRPQAVDVVIAGVLSVSAPDAGTVHRQRNRRKQGRRSGGGRVSMLSLVIPGVFAAALSWLIVGGELPLYAGCWYLGVSGLTFVFYYNDKRAAVRGHSRIPESNLHVLALAGGWPGALLAQQLFRHKSRKTAFRLVLWMTVGLNLAALWLWFSGEGAGLFRMAGLLPGN